MLLLCVQLAGSVGGRVVRGLSGLDVWLEGNKVLPVLKPLEIPDDVKDESGELNAECKEVRWPCAVFVCAGRVLFLVCAGRVL